MIAQPEATDLSPPQPPGRGRSIVLALVAHGALIAALTLGVQWNRTADPTPVVAELWARIPREAAPREQAPAPVPAPPAAPAPALAPPTPPAAEADIAREREKRREALIKERERERQREEALARQRKAEAEKVAARKAQAERAEQEKANRERETKAREEQRRKAEDAARRKAADEQAETARIEAQRQENLRRMAGLAGATGAEGARGAAESSAGPSAGYAARVEARVRPNIVFADADRIQGNPAAEVEVRCAPDGTILGAPRLVKSSGLRAWDDAVLRAIEKTEVMPRDVDGRVPSPMLIVLRPKR